ncbi:DNA helicase/exodeoxyribonuclease V, subunit A [Desulforamulus reducens MI-1]|uniref:ATP-dependent helicase/nuclease subunit A n=1 Tax=Desulforamulus reducens (strain ATCC BAA-1160 / DSM 100696 / MI-1) TaxID=349161 RepID=ADDA_DESRM|nr:helicase-exonuclease AddAB subunit AddA [Desulforamulus reducens]A4J4E3.1 RecName: Full=ATP-dependent helicase/nuclease subunit A; AltName: Full=ATP-dependent helicase/nuclease AddA; AltName: Full=DNA 3'-5' helicase AddA [Desulforamulus reducens MI-1]ABO49946.1 DNA helicase/exodeoxyribonuclease V, subunit A [Desulforamulus reducens MI-1]
MSDKKWTAEQLAAITTRDTNLLVAAAAGAGKTAVLVERIIGLITDPHRPVDVDQLLIVTFTNAAAAEMRERIGQALSKALQENPHSKRLARQLTMLNRASITTLHSFCLDLLRRYFYQLDLDPGFRVADEVEAELLRLDVLEELFERRYNQDNVEVFARLVDSYGGQRDDSRLQDLVLELYRFSGSHPLPVQWLTSLAENYVIPEGKTLDDQTWIVQIKKTIFQEVEGVLGLLKQAQWLAKQPGGPEPYSKTLTEDIINIKPLTNNDWDASWEKLYRSITAIKWSKLSPCRGEIDDQLKNKAQNLRNKAKEKFNDIINTYFSAEPTVILEDLRSLQPLIADLAKLTIEFMELYQKKKQAKGLVDFGDLEHYCLTILLDKENDAAEFRPSAVAIELQQQYAEVLVDEYQDINAVQETILRLVSKKNNRFMVGDVKQSIYRFRLAEPKLFLSKSELYANTDNCQGTRIGLSKNFRSRLEVVNAVNFIFRQIMTKKAGEITYDELEELHCGADYPQAEDVKTATGPVEVYLIDRKDAQLEEQNTDSAEEKLTDGEEQEDLDSDQAEARLIGRRIQAMVKGTDKAMGPEFKVWDKEIGKYRPVSYRDIVILLRATTGRANTFLEELRTMGVPTYAEVGTGYFEAVEVETFLSLLKIIDNPRQDVPLAGVLRSPVVGLKASDLAEIRLCSKEGDFYDAVRIAAAADLGDVAVTLTKFLRQLENWRSRARRDTLADLIWLLYRETGYYDYVGGMVGGTQRQANLRVLYHRAKQFEATSFRGLFRFLRFVERLKDSGSDLGAARSLSENEDVVRIMSIHKSKGLEFPVLFVAGLGKRFNMMDLNKDMLMHKELGLGPQIIHLGSRVSYPSLPKLLIKQQIRKESVAEEMRVLYVALTRAREKLILVGAVRDLEKSLEKWCTSTYQAGWTLPDAELMAAKCYLDWLCPAIARHHNGHELRSLAKTEGQPFSEVATDPSAWQLVFQALKDIKNQTQENKEQSQGLLVKIKDMEPFEDAGLIKEVERRLSWQYPRAEVTTRPAKAAVTEVKHKFDELARQEAGVMSYRPKISGRPRFLQQDKGLTPAERGSAIHLVMQHIPLDKLPDEEGVQVLLQNLIQKEILLPQQAAAINPNHITGFFASSIGQRVLQAPKVERELPFSLALPATEVYQELPECGDEMVLVQGVIDCLVDEGDGFLLIDYKSDAVYPGQDSPVDRYRGQINLYARAVQDILGKPVKDRVIYLFNNGQIVHI